MSSDDARHTPRGELTDDELNSVLSSAGGELLAYVRAAADPTAALVAIMTASASDAADDSTATRPQPANDQHAVAVLTARARARDLNSAIRRAHDIARDIPRHLNSVLGTVLDVAFEMSAALGDNHHKSTRHHTFALLLALRRARSSASPKVLARAREGASPRVRDLDIAVRQARDIACALDSAMIRIRDLDSPIDSGKVRVLDLGVALDNAEVRVRDLDSAVASAVTSASDLRPARAIAQDLDRSLDSIKALANTIPRKLDAIEVNASGANLSHLDLSNFDVLCGVIWTEDTTWPPGIENLVKNRSQPIGPGIFQVHGGSEHNPSLVTV